MAAVFALSVVPVVGMAGAALDYSRATTSRTDLQSAADRAALAAIRAEVATDAERIAAAKAVFGSATPIGSATAEASGDARRITVLADATIGTTVIGVLGVDTVGLAARATAVKVFEGEPPCILALNRSVSGALTITGSAEFVGRACTVYSNSASSTGMVLESSTPPIAAGYCSAGGVSTNHLLQPRPRRFCEVIEDPFRSIVAPTAAHCDYSNVEVGPKDTVTLRPGSYCGGLTLKGSVTMEPGIYVVRNGPLVVTSQASVTGAGVTISLTGTNAGFTFDAGGATDLEAPTDGALGGMLIIQDKYANPGHENRLAGGADARLVGAIYTPTQKVTLTGNAGFGQLSPFMPIVADQVRISGANFADIDLAGMTLAAPLPKTESGARLVE